jgi:DNA-binding Xre family transcriptional regulator
MLKYNFTRLFKARGINKPYTYLVNIGFTPSIATKIKNNKYQRLSIDHIEKLCLAFNCTPNDLMEWQPKINSKNIDQYQLKQLIREESMIDINAFLQEVPIEKLQKAQELIKGLIQED